MPKNTNLLLPTLVFCTYVTAWGKPLPNIQQHTIIVPSTGEYATIDNKPIQSAMQILGGSDVVARQKEIDTVLAHPDRFAPPVLYALSEALFQTGKKDEASFYFYAGQLRARFDANRCTDVTARDGVSILNDRYGPLINKYTFQDLDKLEALIPRVVAWDRKTPHNYDPRWLAPHGMGAFVSDGKPAPLTLPKEQWDKIAEDTRMQYLDSFREALAGLKKQGKEAIVKP